MLTEAYEIRSIYIHGSFRKPKREKKALTHDEMEEVFRVVTEYARLTCVILLQLCLIDQRNNSDLIRLLTESMIDDSAKEKFAECCRTVKFASEYHAGVIDNRAANEYIRLKLLNLIGVPDGIRTRVIAVKGRCPRPG
jgi:hypothetical protein